MIKVDITGKTLKEAVEIVEAAGGTVRVTSRDGEHYVSTRDYRVDRVNVHLVGGLVTRHTVG
ncbi:hypothetical protein [Xanthomonas phage JGB6]|nr:hypothetical protein [Xanthomonas phage JGB6]